MPGPVATTETLRLQRAALADFGLFAFRCEDVDSLLHRAVELVSEALHIPLVKVLEHRPERGEMLIRSGLNWDPGVVGRETFGDDEKSPGGYALRSDRPVVSPDLDTEDRFETPDVLRRHGVKSMINVIIVGQRMAFGVLEVDSREPRDFTEDDVAFLQTYANLLAAAIERNESHAALQRLAREQEVLVHELRDRVGNLFSLVRAIASQMSATDLTAEEFREAFNKRLQALAAAESLVFESSQERVDAGALARKVLVPYRQDGATRILIDGGSPYLSARQARMFGLAIHELATNAAKHGALSVSSGRVRLHWRVPEDFSRVTLVWEETDGPEITQPERKGFGTRLLEEVVAIELNGEGSLSYRPTGLHYELSFPLERD